MPEPVVLVLGGLAIGLIPGVPRVELSPDVVFFVFLPPLVYASAFTFSSEQLRANARAIGFLAIGLVLATMAGVAAVAHWVVGIGWGPAFVLGAVLGPTDPVAATSVAKRLGAPDRIAAILQGEALINDGTGLVTLKVAVGAVGASFALGSAALDFAYAGAAGVAVGLVVGFAAARLRRHIDEPQIEITISLIAAYGAYVLADRLEASGVLAGVAAGVYAGTRAPDVLSPATRVQATAFFSSLGFMLESLLFLLVGLQIRHVLGGIERSAAELAGYSAAVIAAVVLLRLAWMFTVPKLLATDVPASERAVIGWSGLRGAVSLAAALSIPLTVAGDAFPDRALVIFLAYVTVIATLVVPALTLPFLISRLGLAQSDTLRRQELEVRRRLARMALRRVDELADRMPESAVERVRDVYEARIDALEQEDRDERDDWRGAYRDLRRRLLAEERSALARLRSEREVSPEILRELSQELDLEEARLTR